MTRNEATTCDLAWAYAAARVPSETPANDARRILLERLATVEMYPVPTAESLSDDDDDPQLARRTVGLDVAQYEALMAIADIQAEVVDFRSGPSETEENWKREHASAFIEQSATLPPDERDDRLRAMLRSRQPSAAIRSRLRRLKQSIDFQTATLDDASQAVQRIVGAIHEMVALPPSARGRKRAELLEQCRDDPRKWRIAAQDLRKKFPRIAAIDPALLKRLMERPAELRARGTSAIRTTAPIEPDPVFVTRNTGPSLGEKAWLMYIAFGIVMSLIMAMTGYRGPGKQREFGIPRSAPANYAPPLHPIDIEIRVDQEGFRRTLDKPSEELTPRERDQLIFLGFMKADSELSSAERWRLKFYGLEKLRIAWRNKYMSGPRASNSVSNSSNHGKPEPTDEP